MSWACYSGEGKTERGIFSVHTNTLRAGIKRIGPYFSVVPSDRIKSKGYKLKPRKFH